MALTDSSTQTGNPYGNTMYNPMNANAMNPMQQPNYFSGLTNYQSPGGIMGGLQQAGSNFLGGLGNNILGGFANGVTNALFAPPQTGQKLDALPEFTQGNMGTMYGTTAMNNAVNQSSTGMGLNSSAYAQQTSPQELMDQYTAAQKSITDYNAEQDEANSHGFLYNVGNNFLNMFK
jgi:hypothetical protein